MADFQELGTIKNLSTGGWVLPTKKLGDGCLCTDGTFSKGNFLSANVCFATLEDVCLVARRYYLSHNKVYPWWIVGDETIGWVVTSFNGKTIIKEDRSFSAQKTTGQQEGIVLQSGSIIQSEEMKF